MGLMRFFLACIEQRRDPIEAFGMNGFKLRGVDDAVLKWQQRL